MKKTYTGKTLDELLASASAEKNCSIEDLVYEIVEEKAGFLGLGKEVKATVYAPSDVSEFLKTYLMHYFEQIEMQAHVEIEQDDAGYYRVDLDTENNAILIGKNGQTLQAITNLLKAVVSSEFKKRIGVFVDVNGYKEDKYKKLCVLAKRIAKTVQQSKTDAVLDAMPADERKVIHQCLANMRDIATVSEGEGKDRRLKIMYHPGKEID